MTEDRLVVHANFRGAAGDGYSEHHPNVASDSPCSSQHRTNQERHDDDGVADSTGESRLALPEVSMARTP